MKEQKFHIGHFPTGTIVQVQVGGHGPVIETEVTGIACNGPHSWVLKTIEPCSLTGTKSYNIDHVIGIIKRGAGAVTLIDVGSTSIERKNAISKRNGDTKSFIGIRKHHSQYLALSSASEIVYAVAIDMITDDMLIDNQKLVDLLIAGGHIHIKQVSSGHTDFHWHILQINKKKLKNAIRRVINKACVKRVKAQEEESKAQYDAYKEDMEDMMQHDMAIDASIWQEENSDILDDDSLVDPV